jgi:hypothetical protein
MAVPMVDSSTALAIAASIDYPDASALGTAGTHVVYQNHYYLLRVDPASGDYQAWDISVYDPSSGNVETGAFDVYYDAVKGGVAESVQAIGSGTLWLALGALALFIIVSAGKR